MPSVVVLGMHRSGTSLVSQALDVCGISAGPGTELLSAQSDNPEGFLENRQLVALNDALLASVDASWYSPSISGDLDPGEHAADMAALLEHLARATEKQFFLKDPRLCLTLSAWESVWESAKESAKESANKVSAKENIAEPLLAGTATLFVYRSPLSVARSLAKRNKFPLQLGIQLWEIYNRRALSQLQGREFLAVSYEGLMAGQSALSDLVGTLAKQGFACNPANADSVLKGDLQHFSAEASGPDQRHLRRGQKALHDYCSELCAAGPLVTIDKASLDSLSPKPALLARTRDLAAAMAPLARVVETGNERDEAIGLVGERTSERDTALQSLQSLESDHDALVGAHKKEKQLHKRASRTLKKLTEEHEALALAHENERRAHADVAERFVASQQDLSEQTQKADFLFHSVTESYRNLLSFETSMMARLQRVVRRAYRFVTGQRGKNSAYEDLLERAHQHFSEYELDRPVRRKNKLDMLFDVLRYIGKNPASSLRSFSWHRLRRAASVFFGSSSDDLGVWVNARFPGQAAGLPVFDPTAMDPDLDILELVFSEPESPEVSIIIPVFNDYRVTMNCLRSLLEHSAGHSYEVILADDCSSDLTATITERVSGIRVARTTENQRFLLNCKQAAEHARGEVLLFLNNDTAVTPDWLGNLLRPFAEPDVGVVGPKLLFADGLLQEAGGIIWRDASGWNFGRGDNPDKPAYNYRREVDYVSGACLAVRRELWDSLEGFDERFVPAYYEDADLCFAAREAGFRVMYEPSSVIFHFEGVSNGTDLTAGVKKHQVTNQAVFREKWASELDKRHFPNAEQAIYARDRSAARYTVLIIDHYVPHFDRDAGGRSTYQYAKLLLEMGCRVQFMGANFFAHQPYTQHLQELGVEVLVGESVARDLGAWLREHAAYIDEIFLHRPHVAEQFLDHLERMQPRPPISFFGHDLHYLRVAREAKLKNDSGLAGEAEQWRKRELAVISRVDRAYYFSRPELQALEEFVPAEKLRHVPLYAMPVKEILPYAPEEPHSLLFVGGYNHPPNVDAAMWLVQDILPLLRASLPSVSVHLVGSNVPASIKALSSDAVTVHGYLSDEALEALYRKIGIAMVPLQYGAGVKGKVIEAVTQGVPVITTPIGAEGIPEAESIMWIADSAEDLAKKALQLMMNEQSLETYMPRAQAWIDEHFSLHSAAHALRKDRPGLPELPSDTGVVQ